MDDKKQAEIDSDARIKRREQIVEAAIALAGVSVPLSFDPVHSPLCVIDVVMVAGAPWLKEALEKDYIKDESGYKKIGGGANSPKAQYFCRNTANLIHFLKRQGFYMPQGGKNRPASGMVCFLDWSDHGRFNFSPDRSGIIVSAKNGTIESIVMATNKSKEGNFAFTVELVQVQPKSALDLAVIGYSDLP